MFQTMEALYFLKFWRPTAHNHNNKDHLPRHSSGAHSDTTTELATSVVDTTTTDDDYDFDEHEDSFFELELTADLDTINNNIKCHWTNTNINIPDNVVFDSNHPVADLKHNFLPPPLSLSPSDTNNNTNINTNLIPSKRKILPIERQPQSPSVSLLKAPAPKFRVLMFKKSKSIAAHETEFLETPKNDIKNSSKKQETGGKFFTVKFKLKESANVSIFNRDNSLRKQISSDDCFSDHESSKRFSKEMIQKYLKLIKPLYVKVSKKPSEKPRFSTDRLSVVSPSSSPATLPSCSPKKEKQGSIPAGIRVVCKHLGKSKSSSAGSFVAPQPTVSRRDDSLLLQHDGIQGAILHCKKSFNSSSSRDSTLLSRFASDVSPRISHEENGI